MALDKIIVDTQKNLTEYEQRLGDGGGGVECIARNKIVNVGAAVNTHPQAWVNPIGREVPSAVMVSEAGAMTTVTGVPEYNEVDNASMFPCGTYSIQVGNRFNVKAGGGGINLSTTGKIQLQTDGIIKIGAYQIVEAAEDIIINGTQNLSITSPNLNLTCPNQIVLNGSVGVNSNMIVKGSTYVNGEVYLNHITAPLEIQTTIPGFTKEGALGFLRVGKKFNAKVTGNMDTTHGTGYIVGNNLTIEIITSETVVELTPHAHEFPNLPLTLSESSGGGSAQGGVRAAAGSANSPSAVGAKGITNGAKSKNMRVYTEGDCDGMTYNGSSTSTSVI